MKILISGASRGLGEALVRYFCQEHQVVSFARGELPISHPNLKHYGGIDATSTSDLDKIAVEMPSVTGHSDGRPLLHAPSSMLSAKRLK